MASSSSSTPKRTTYDVFLNFRGEDTRANFVDHLYTALNDRGIYTFKDDQTLQRGKSVAPELLKAIEQSRFAIVIFSRNYADSPWCLDELVKIIDCKNSNSQTVLPVFYDVAPSEVRKQTGYFGKAFAKHERRRTRFLRRIGINGGKNEIQIQRWKNALSEAANLAGWALPNVSNRYESKCIKEIVRNLSSDLAYNTTSIIGGNFIGMEPRVQNVKSLLLKGLDEVYMVGIWGMGGMGKTTLARAVFNDISNHFEGKSFVANVREVSKSVSGLKSLQEKILTEVLMERKLKVSDIDEGSRMMSRLCHKKVLIVLDDVDRVEQLETLAGNREWFGKGSRIIITTRDEHLLVLHEVNEIHKAVLLDKDESLSLFNKHAFKSNIPQHEYVEPSNVIINSVGGLPLAIRVLGSFLYGRTMVEWKGAIEKLKKHSANREILGVLKISFDGLEHNEQEIFLDIACFFIGKKKEDVSEILDSFDFYPDIGLSVLIEKSLLNIVNGTLQMHDMIKELAWDIVYQMDPKEPGRRSRLWLLEDVQAVLTNDTGTEAIEGIQFDNSYLSNSFEALRNMNKLRLLDVIDVTVRDECEGPVPECLSNELRWIRWERYPSKCLPPNFNAKKLVHLHMHRSNIVELWKGRKILDKLKLIDLSFSELITKTPDFSGVPNLEKLILEHCMNLEEVHSSLGDLQRLTFLNLSWCQRLKRLPFGFNMKSLEIIFLNNCWELEVFPQILGDMNRLTKLHLNNTAIKDLHYSIGKLTGLVLLDLNSCHDIKSLPTTIGSLKSLKSLNLGFCTGLEDLPETLGHIESLEDLNLNWAAIREPPSSITLLKNLKTLSFGSYKDYISASKGESISYHASSLLWQNLSGLFLKRLVIAYCQLAEVPDGISELSSLEELSLAGNVFTYLPDSLCQLSRLKSLALNNCKNLKSLPELPLSIAMLDIDDCPTLESIGDLLVSKREFLHDVSLKDCIRLVTNKQRCAYSSFTLSHKVLQTMLQWRSVVKHHQFSILVPGKETPEWEWQDTETSCSHLKLLPDWDKSILGFAMCRSIRSTAPDEASNDFPNEIAISLGHKYKKTLEHTVWRFRRNESYAVDHLWIGYISLDFFGKLIFGDTYKKENDWTGGNDASFLEIYYHKSYLSGSGNFGVRVIYKEDLNHIIDEEEDHMITPANYADDYGFYPNDEENN